MTTLSARLLDAIVESAPVAMLLSCADGGIRWANRGAEALFGYGRDELVGQPVELLVPVAARAAHASLRQDFYAHPSARNMGVGRELFGQRKDGSQVPIEIGLTPLDTEYGPCVLTVIIDTTSRRRLEAQRSELDRLSREDPLTHLANRRDFDQRLASEIERAERHGTPLSVAMLDLDRFKGVNDRFGHAVGDAVLRQVAELIRQRCRVIDVVARYGGEEFAVALPGTEALEAAMVCERIRTGFEQFDWNRLQPGLRMTISAGIGSWSPGDSGATVLAKADTHLYEAKRLGRNRVLPAVTA